MSSVLIMPTNLFPPGSVAKALFIIGEFQGGGTSKWGCVLLLLHTNNALLGLVLQLCNNPIQNYFHIQN